MVMSWVAANRPKPVPPHRSTSSPHVKMTTSRVDGSNMESIAHFAEAATNAIHSQRREIDRLSGCLGRLENDVHFLKKFMTEMQRNISKRTFDENREQISKNLQAFSFMVLFDILQWWHQHLQPTSS